MSRISRRLAQILLGLISMAAGAQTCTSIRQFDFRNSQIPIAARDASGASSGPELFRLENGEGFISDDPDDPQSHDWGLSLLADRLEHPDPSTWIRVIVVEKDHLTGSGDWRYVLAFACERGSLTSLFQFGEPGVVLDYVTGQTLELTQAIWGEGDAQCCPTRSRNLTYKWNPQRHRYDLSRSKPVPHSTAQH
ncbi:MAG TPA: hypothetical protein VIY53_08430 [Acidobacteriaceae bacterium]